MPATKKRKTTKKGDREKETEGKNFNREIILLIILALSVILLISNFGIGGKIGRAHV